MNRESPASASVGSTNLLAILEAKFPTLVSKTGASSIIFVICPTRVASPTAEVLTTILPSRTINPARISSPGRDILGTDSPVNLTTSNEATPDSITPSIGTLSPGKKETRSPAESSKLETITSP